MKENFWKKKRHQSALKHALYSASINIFNALNSRHTCNHLWSMQNRWGCAYLWCGHTGSAKIMHSTPLTKGTSGRVHKLQSKSQTNALEPSSSYSFLFLWHSKVLFPPLRPSSPVARAPLAKMFCWHAKVLAQVASLPFSLPNAWHLPQLSCDRGRAREGGWGGTSCEVR